MLMDMDEQLEFLRLIVSRLDPISIPYMLTGSLAMAIYAVPRMTRDIDAVIECSPEDATRIFSLFEPDCYVDIERIHEAASRRTKFNIIHNEWIVKADFIVRKNEPYRNTEFARRRQFEIQGSVIWVVAPEDLILSKLVWAKESGSEIQKRDAGAIAAAVADLDWTYLRQWAADLSVSPMLEGMGER
jgi:hypothetical protein